MANVNRPYRSSELAGLAGVSTDTLRFYERNGLLAKPPRTNGNYRVYPAEALKRVQLVRGGLSLGFSVAELRQLLALRDRGGIPCLQARKLAQSKLEAIEQDIHELQALRKVMQKALRSWDEKINAGPVVARLGLLETFVEANPEAAQRRSPLLPRALRNFEKRKQS
jgi:MerR family copper efflux transcriptional regulator